MAALRRDLEQAAKYEPYSRYGELLKANLGSLKKGLATVTVVDYYDETLPELTIPLDPTKAPQANMDAYFAKYRKFVSARREIAPGLAAIEAEVRQVQAELDTPSSMEPGKHRPSMGIVHHARRNPPLAVGPQPRNAAGPFGTSVSSDGHHIFVGRNARENDELTFGLAKSDDPGCMPRAFPVPMSSSIRKGRSRRRKR